MGNIPQANCLNPARLTDNSKVIVSLPLLAGLDFNFSNSYSFNDLGHIDNKELTLDFGQFYSKIPTHNYFSEAITLPLVGFQYRTKDKNFSFSISEKQFMKGTFDKNLIKLINEGNYAWLGSNFSTELDFNFLHYREYSLGYSQQVIDKLKIGSRIKLLTGFSTIDVRQMNIGIETAENIEFIKFYGNGSYNLSLPVSFKSDQHDSSDAIGSDPISYLTNPSNLGFSFDLGVTYQLLPELELSASLIDIGFIGWKSNVFNLSNFGSFTWKGIDLTKISDQQEINEEPYLNPLQSIIDSVSKITNLNIESKQFRTGLPTKLYIAANYKVSPIFNAGIVDKILFYNRHVSNSLTLSGNLQIAKIFSLSAGYSIIDKSFNNLAIGSSIKLGPFEIYCATGNILTFRVMGAKNFSMQFGLNFMFETNDNNQ